MDTTATTDAPRATATAAELRHNPELQAAITAALVPLAPRLMEIAAEIAAETEGEADGD